MFLQVANQQLSAAVDELGAGVLDSDIFKDILRDRIRSVHMTQAVEDMNGSQSKLSLEPCRRFRKPATAMAAALGDGLVDVRHKFEMVDSAAPAPCRRPSLPKEIWQPPIKGSLKFEEIVSVKQNPDFFSTSADRMTCVHADAHLIRHAKSAGGLHHIDRAYLGQAFEAKHNLAVGIRQAPESEDVNWYLAMYHSPLSSVMVWPVVKVPFGNHFFFQFDTTVNEPTFISILSLDENLVQVAWYQWRSWLWQCKEIEASGEATALGPALRPFIIDEGSFLQVACRAGWWELSHAQISAYASYFKKETPPGSSLFELLWDLAAGEMQDEHEILRTIERRCALDTSSSDAASALLEGDCF